MRDVLAALLPLVFLSGCTAIQKDAAAVQGAAQKLANSSAIELVLHGDEAEWVRKQAAARGGVVDPDAVTIGTLIIYLTPQAFDAADLRRHEFAHVLQWRADPLGFPVRYLVQTQLVGYADNPFEVAARAAGDDPKAPTADADR